MIVSLRGGERRLPPVIRRCSADEYNVRLLHQVVLIRISSSSANRYHFPCVGRMKK